jgi:hypothetical protein
MFLQRIYYHCHIWAQFKQFCGLYADAVETPTSCASRLRDFLSKGSRLALVSSNASSVSTVYFLSGFLSSNEPVIFSLLIR